MTPAHSCCNEGCCWHGTGNLYLTSQFEVCCCWCGAVSRSSGPVEVGHREGEHGMRPQTHRYTIVGDR